MHSCSSLNFSIQFMHRYPRTCYNTLHPCVVFVICTSFSSLLRMFSVFRISLTYVPVLSPVSSPPCIPACHVQSFTDGRSLQWVFGLHATALVIHTCRALFLCCRLCCPCHLYILVIHVLPVLFLSSVHNSHPCNACSLCFVSHWAMSLCCRLWRLLPVSLPCSVFHRRAIIAVGFRPACNRPRDPYILSSVPVLSPVSTMSVLYTRHPCIACVVFVICT